METNLLKSSRNLKAVIFDYGEVLCHAPTDEENAKLARFRALGAEPRTI
jgi:hypothetical protein